MGLPSKLKHMNIFNDANSYLGLAKKVTLPKLSRKLESYRGGGMGGPVKVDLGFGDDGLQLEYTVGGLDLVSLRQFGTETVGGVPLRFAGSYQEDAAGDVTAVEVVVNGRPEELDFGDAEPGADTEHKVVMTCSYYKLVVNGITEVELDFLGMIENVGGVDRLEAHRKIVIGI